MTKKIDEERLNAILDRYARMDELDWLAHKRKMTKKKMKKSRQHMSDLYGELTDNPPVPDTGWGKAIYYLERGATLVQGVKMGFKIGDAIKALAGLRKRK